MLVAPSFFRIRIGFGSGAIIIVLRVWSGWTLTFFFCFRFFFFFFIQFFYSSAVLIAQASGFSVPGAVGGLPEERGGAAEEVATGSIIHSGSSAPAPAQFHLGEVKFSESIRFVHAGPHLSS